MLLLSLASESVGTAAGALHRSPPVGLVISGAWPPAAHVPALRRPAPLLRPACAAGAILLLLMLASGFIQARPAASPAPCILAWAPLKRPTCAGQDAGVLCVAQEGTPGPAPGPVPRAPACLLTARPAPQGSWVTHAYNALLLNEFQGLQLRDDLGGLVPALPELPANLQSRLSKAQDVAILLSALVLLRGASFAVLVWVARARRL